jgi:predicted negative regulator of RcsB-dependent stress response
VDNRTRHKLKEDHFITSTKHGLEWAGENRRSVITTSILLLAAILVCVGGVALYNYRSDAAAAQFGMAMVTYTTPIATPGEPMPEGAKSFSSAAERSKASNAEFSAIAQKYGLTPAGRNALYFTGLTDIEAGQTASAETTLNKIASGWDKDLAALAKVALASLYHQSGRDAQAIDIYKQLIAKPAETETAGMAKLQLAALYEATGRNDDAMKIYAELKDKDAKGAAGEVAAQKLGGGGAAGAQ